MDIDHYNQPQKRKAELIRPPNLIKAKVGSGGLSDLILDRAQKLLESTTVDFVPLAEIYLDRMKDGISNAEESLLKNTANSGENQDNEFNISRILYPCAQLKANGGMFHYPLVTRIAGRFIQFMEVIDGLDRETLEIATAFHTTIRAVIKGKIKGDGGTHGDALVEALNDACMRYFEKHKEALSKKQS